MTPNLQPLTPNPQTLPSALIIAAPMSGSGKTTLTAGLIGALRGRGLAVQPFKCGPDYIDPGYHTLAAGRLCRNLDTWLLQPGQVQTLFARASAGADFALIEGVMGLFDGREALDDTGSTADVARLLDVPVVLVLDARGMARSAAAVVDGFRRFDARVRIAGVLLNRVGSARHADLCATAIADYTGLPCFGYLPRDAAFTLPERHLGLVTTAEEGPWTEVLARVAATLAETCDLDRLVAAGHRQEDKEPRKQVNEQTRFQTQNPKLKTQNLKLKIAVAQDAAFSFMYPEMREMLEAAGAQVETFSPMRDATLPENTRGVILCGGFPELYAEALSNNATMHAALRSAHAADTPIYAECGGLMYLTEVLRDAEHRAWPMVGLLPGESAMTGRVTLGYRTVRAHADGPLLPAGVAVRGHEFHYSRWERPAELPAAYTVLARDGSDDQAEGFQRGALLASYVHLHWLAQPDMAARFVQQCAEASEEVKR